MQRLKLISILFLLLLYVGCQSRKEVQTGKIDKNVNEFLEKMTLEEKMAQITAYEMRASNLTLTFGPGLDLGKHPLWSRLSETYGEDIFLAASLAKKSVDGLEGLDNNISDKNKIASCIKHFIAYGFPLTGKDRTPAWIPEHYVGNILCLPLFSTFKVARIPYC